VEASGSTDVTYIVAEPRPTAHPARRDGWQRQRGRLRFYPRALNREYETRRRPTVAHLIRWRSRKASLAFVDRFARVVPDENPNRLSRPC
jgi:hypothetical protein